MTGNRLFLNPCYRNVDRSIKNSVRCNNVLAVAQQSCERLINTVARFSEKDQAGPCWGLQHLPAHSSVGNLTFFVKQLCIQDARLAVAVDVFCTRCALPNDARPGFRSAFTKLILSIGFQKVQTATGYNVDYTRGRVILFDVAAVQQLLNFAHHDSVQCYTEKATEVWRRQARQKHKRSLNGNLHLYCRPSRCTVPLDNCPCPHTSCPSYNRARASCPSYSRTFKTTWFKNSCIQSREAPATSQQVLPTLTCTQLQQGHSRYVCP